MDTGAVLRRFARRRVYFDANVFIFVLTHHERYGELCSELLQACADGEIFGLSGHATLAELLVKPLRDNDARTVFQVHEILGEDCGITLVEHNKACFEQAAALRARHKLKWVDALHLATAIHAGAACFVSHDFQFPQMPEIECLTLD